MASTMAPVVIVIQSDPRVDKRYFDRISAEASDDHVIERTKTSRRSRTALSVSIVDFINMVELGPWCYAFPTLRKHLTHSYCKQSYSGRWPDLQSTDTQKQYELNLSQVASDSMEQAKLMRPDAAHSMDAGFHAVRRFAGDGA